MRLRPRQQQAVDASLVALETFRNTLLVAPTGAGKTIMLSGVCGQRILRAAPDAPNKGLVLQHRDELVDQNLKKFRRVNANIPVSIFDANSKSWRGRAVFAMVQSLARSIKNPNNFPPLDNVTVDEAHHVPSNSYQDVLGAALEANPECVVLGVTATPNRGDGKGLRGTFDNVADQITIAELIASGHLVRPRTFVMDVGVTTALQGVRKLSSDFDMTQVAAIMDRDVITERVVEIWKHGLPEQNLPSCIDRKTIVFCSKVSHAEHVGEVFRQAGIRAVVVRGDDKDGRKAALREFEQGNAQVIVCVAVLTEGWDYQPASCVILLRPSSYKSTLMQMVGRVLRTVDPAEFPGVVKTDAIVLDFGTASLTHGALEDDADLDGKPKGGEIPMKLCPEDEGGCGASVPIGTLECPLCGFEWERQPKDRKELRDFVMTEIDLLSRSNFKWIDIWGDEAALIATGFDAWAGLFWLKGLWHAIGGTKSEMRHLGIGDRVVALAIADDFLNSNETDNGANKAKRWLRDPATPKQLEALGLPAYDTSVSKYNAMCRLSFKFNARAIRSFVETYSMEEAA